MDPLDLRLIRTMGIRPYGHRPQNPEVLRPSHLAKRLHIEPETVKAHLARMEASGFIRFYQVYPNFRHLGLESAAYLCRVPDDDQKASAIERMQLIDGLVEVHNFLGAEVCVEVTYRAEHDLSRKLRLLAEFTGDAKPTRFYDRDMPPVRHALTRSDWRIISALRYRGRRPLAEVGDEIGMSARTVRRRYDRMMKEGSMFIGPTVDASRAPGTVLFELLFYTAPQADASTPQRVLRTFEDRYLYHYVPVSPALGNFDVLLAADSTGDIEAMRQRGRLIPGIEKVSALVFRGWSESTDWIDAAIQEKLTSADRNAGTPP
ncbi:MAG TPA: winged helix-turn-helix transcriptional regulator [Thermoplasmata archaeon]|nr:winged helix-turn-helix transcriptional regulator [Thermoplasmata archaeon]